MSELRRWFYLKTGWGRLFRPDDWMPVWQQRQSVHRYDKFLVRQILGEPTYKLGGRTL